MPELPEVDHLRQSFSKVAVGANVASIDAHPDPIIFTNGTTHTLLQATLQGAKIVSCERYGKWMYTRIEPAAGGNDAGANPPESTYWYLHLGMTGSLRIKGHDNTTYLSSNIQYASDAEEWPPKYAKFWFTLTHAESGAVHEVAFCDPRRLGKCFVQTTSAAPRSVPPLSLLGFDPVHCMPDLAQWTQLLARRSPTSPIKAVLLDQAFAAGVGNWIADEVLYQAGVHPQSTCAAVVANAHVVASIRDGLSIIVTQACQYGPGGYPREWLFHYRWAKRGKGKQVVQDAHGRKVEFVSVGGRTAAYVPEVQKLLKVAASAMSREEQRNESDLSSLEDIDEHQELSE
ncbi:Formamidopyrimidine-DNA glycosylase N-terminal domain-domain-containing protein, partial [Catenaria anguillulae PL171]